MNQEISITHVGTKRKLPLEKIGEGRLSTPFKIIVGVSNSGDAHFRVHADIDQLEDEILPP